MISKDGIDCSRIRAADIVRIYDEGQWSKWDVSQDVGEESERVEVVGLIGGISFDDISDHWSKSERRHLEKVGK